MHTEVEVKFLDIDIDDMRSRLKAVGASCEQPMRKMRRVLIEQPEHEAEHSFIRVRDQGDKITLTFKRRAKEKLEFIDDTKEIEVEVSSFEDTIELLKQAGWPYKTYQENRRETWMLNGAEVVIDEWPWLSPQIEIEAEDEATVRAAAEKLGLDWNDAFYGHIDHAYQTEYTFAPDFRGIITLSEVRFEDPVPKQMIPKGR
jgi:adenylate cyclase class 2